jgi:hypothetical protein
MWCYIILNFKLCDNIYLKKKKKNRVRGTTLDYNASTDLKNVCWAKKHTCASSYNSWFTLFTIPHVSIPCYLLIMCQERLLLKISEQSEQVLFVAQLANRSDTSF